jgi:hypothetical protein
MLLLTGFMSNAENAKKMDAHNKDDRLFNFFNIKLDCPIKFGKHQILMTALPIAKRRPKPSSEHVVWKFKKYFSSEGRKQLNRLVINYKHAATISKPSAKKNGRSSAVTLHCSNTSLRLSQRQTKSEEGALRGRAQSMTRHRREGQGGKNGATRATLLISCSARKIKRVGVRLMRLHCERIQELKFLKMWGRRGVGVGVGVENNGRRRGKRVQKCKREGQ